MTIELVGSHEVAEMLGVNRQRVHQLVQDDPNFPEPLATLASGRIWDRRDIQEWMRTHRRPAGRPKVDR